MRSTGTSAPSALTSRIRRTRRTRWGGTLVAAAGLMVLVACAPTPTDGEQLGMWPPRGTGAQVIDTHWWTMLIIGGAVWVIVTVMLIATMIRRRQDPKGDGRRGPLFVAVAGAVIPGVIVAGVMAQAVVVLQQTNPLDDDGETVIEVTGHKFWWEVEYPEEGVVTANEIHIPTGQRVRLELTAADVIHSVWVPQLGGKTDMVPGHANSMWLETDEPGQYWGQCAEYCGVQHAQMRFLVIAHEPEEYQSWLAHHSQAAEDGQLPAAEGAEITEEEELIAWGREVFMSSSCVYCHAVQGTEAQGEFGPDLTHMASRETIGAGILPNNPGNMAAWVVDPQSIKPGNEMPGTDLDGPELQALLAYLESLE